MVEVRQHSVPPGVPNERLYPGHELPRDRVRSALSAPSVACSVFAGAALMTILVPALWLPVAIIASAYAFWISNLRFRLPMRVPQSWPGRDWGELRDGSDTNYKEAGGILYLGTDANGHELWITNSDARRHIFVLGTTGSGKTELLLGLLVQPMMWGSGCMFVDGKGTTEFYARVYSLAKRMGREDDVRLINFTGISSADGADPDAPAGSIGSQSNTLNPFARGTADQLANMITSLMGGDQGGDQMWRDRAVQLVSTLIRALVEMRDAGEILLDVQTLRAYMPLGEGVPDGVKGSKVDDTTARTAVRLRITRAQAAALAAISTEQWEQLKQETSVTALYLRALNGDFSEATRLALQGFMTTLPGYSLAKALAGKAQESKTLEQHGYLTMQLTKPLGTMADDFGHIFRTPLAEVDMEDVIFNRRILVVLLPALQKAPEETKNLGRIIVAMAKSMMGAASGSRVVGTRKEIVETAPTRSPSPFLAIFDEAGYYLVKGMDVMAAQARSLGFSVIVGAQDLQAMRGDNPQAANSVIANTFLNCIGATVDADATLQFIQTKTGKQRVAATTGGQRQAGLLATAPRDSLDYTYLEVDQTTAADLRNLGPGEFKFIFQDRVHSGRGFYVGSDITRSISINTFLPVRGPADKLPGQDRDAEEERYVDDMKNAWNAVNENKAIQPVSSATIDIVTWLAALNSDLGLSGADLAGGSLAARFMTALALNSQDNRFDDGKKSEVPEEQFDRRFFGDDEDEKSDTMAMPGMQG